MDLEALQEKFHGRRFGELVLHLNKHQDMQAIISAYRGTIQALPSAAQPIVESWIDEVNTKVKSEHFWQQDGGIAFMLITKAAEAKFATIGLSPSSDDLFNMFQVIILYFASTTHLSASLKAFIQKSLGEGFLGRLLGIFKKKSLSEQFVERLKPCFVEIVRLVAKINGGPFTQIYEAGIYVSSIATMKILTLDIENPEAIADDFSIKWMSYVINSYTINDKSISPNHYVKRLQELYPLYSDMWANCIQNPDGQLVDDLMYEVFCNCTGKSKYENSKGLALCTLNSLLLIVINKELFKEIRN